MKLKNFIFGGALLGILTLGFFTATQFSSESSGYETKTLEAQKEAGKAEFAKLWWEAHHIDEETGEVATQEKIREGLLEVREMRASQPLRVSELNWTEQGPTNFGGRTRALCVDRNNEDHVYAGSVSGGLFETFDGGDNWQKVPDWDAWYYISSIVQTQDGNIFVGTGDGSPFSEPFSVGGDGVWYKNPSDPNSTWTQVPGTGGWDVNEMAASPANNNVYMALHSPGSLRMWNVGTGGTPSTVNTGGTGSCNEVEVSGDGQVILTRFGTSQASGAYGSKDGGISFQSIMGSGKIPTGSGARMEFTISKERVNGEYICYMNGTNSTAAGTFRSANSGENWTQIAAAASAEDSPINFYRDQGQWNSTNAVDPTNPNRLIVGGIDLHDWTLATQNPVSGGWGQLSLWFLPEFAPLYVHADNHRIIFDSNNKMYIGNDGGVGISENLGESFYPANRGYATIQFYSISVDGNGRLIGGAQDNGTIYNNLQNHGITEWRKVMGGDGFDAAISFFNRDIMFGSIYYGCIRRSSDGGNTFNSWVPNYIGYQVPCELESGADFHFNTKLALGEFYDENSKDSLLYSPTFSAPAGTVIDIPSAATGNLIPTALTEDVYFDDTVFFDPALTIQDFEVVGGGATYQLFDFTWNNVTDPGQDPQVGDVIEITDPIQVTITLTAVNTYDRYFAAHPVTGKVLDLVTDEFRTNIAWDTLKVADPYQSIFLTHARKNGGELYMTRDALRLASTDVKWSRVVEGIGEMFVGEIAYSANLEHVYVATNTGVWRIDGIRDAYSTLDNFSNLTDLRVGNAPGITKTLIYQGAVSGISVNPSDKGDVLITRAGVGGSGRVFRSTTADVATGTGTFTSISGNLSNNVACYDVLVDRTDADLILVGTDFGVFFTNDGGDTWTSSSEGFEEVPVYRIAQNWREGHPNTTRPGEIYIATHGRGMFASDAVLSTPGEITKPIASKFEVMVYPNPLNDEGSVRFELNETANVQMEIYNLSGKRVYANNQKLSPGLHNLNFDARQLDRGAYIIKIKAGDKIASTKFIKR